MTVDNVNYSLRGDMTSTFQQLMKVRLIAVPTTDSRGAILNVRMLLILNNQTDWLDFLQFQNVYNYNLEWFIVSMVQGGF